MSDQPEDSFSSFISAILKPGSSLHPNFLLALDTVFAALFVVLVSLGIMTQGNVHLIALTCIELCLWGSVKWFVSELKRTNPTVGTTGQFDNIERVSEHQKDK